MAEEHAAGLLGSEVRAGYAERLPGASHWVHHDEHERVNQLLIDFFTHALPAREPGQVTIPQT